MGTQVEKDARFFLIKELKDLCNEAFLADIISERKQKCSGTTSETEDDSSIIDVRVYGSFATDLVCSFESDVDLSIWGLVDIEEEEEEEEEGGPSTVSNNHIRFEEEDCSPDAAPSKKKEKPDRMLHVPADDVMMT